MLAWVSVCLQAFAFAGFDPWGLALAWARLAPVVLIVPAFGLPGLPGGLKWAIALVLAASICPAAATSWSTRPGSPFGLLEAIGAGTAIAFAAAVPLWAATMAGSLFDAAGLSRGSVSSKPGPFATLFTLLASAIFFATGSPSRIAAAVMAKAPEGLLDAAVMYLVHGIDMAIAIGAPMLLATLAIDTVEAVVSRASGGAWGGAISLPMRALGLLLLAAALMERVAHSVAMAMVGP